MTPFCELAEAYLEGALGPSEKAAFDAHLPTCAECRPLVEEWREFATAYRQRAEAHSSPPSEADAQRLMRKLRARGDKPVSRRVWMLAPVAVAAAVALVVLRRPAPAEPIPVMVAQAGGALAPATAELIDSAPQEPTAVRIGADELALAPASSLRVIRHDRNAFRARLARGSVAAVVSHKAEGQSFIIEAADMEVSVVGTRFRVVRTENAVRVEVIEGVVRVGRGGTELARVEKGQAWEAGVLGTFGEAQSDAGIDAATPEVDEAVPALPATLAIKLPVERWKQSAVSGRCSFVLPDIRRAAHSNPARADVSQVLGDCLRITGRYAEAAQAYRQVILHARPDEADVARILLAGLLQDKLDEPLNAERIWRAYLYRPQPPVLEAAARVKLARALLAMNQKEEARKELLRVTQHLPSTPAATEALELLKGLSEQ